MIHSSYTDSQPQSPYQDLNFTEWCEIVDTLVRAAMIASCGEPMGIMEIGDRPWADHYAEGSTPVEAIISEIANLNDPEFALIAI